MQETTDKIKLWERPQLPDTRQYATPQDVRSIVSTGYIEWLYLSGKIRTTDTIPSYTPTKPDEQLVLYVSGDTKRLYIYDYISNTWVYSSDNFGNPYVISDNTTINANYSIYFPDHYEIASGVTFEIASGAIVEVG